MKAKPWLEMQRQKGVGDGERWWWPNHLDTSEVQTLASHARDFLLRSVDRNTMMDIKELISKTRKGNVKEQFTMGMRFTTPSAHKAPGESIHLGFGTLRECRSEARKTENARSPSRRLRFSSLCSVTSSMVSHPKPSPSVRGRRHCTTCLPPNRSPDGIVRTGLETQCLSCLTHIIDGLWVFYCNYVKNEIFQNVIGRLITVMHVIKPRAGLCSLRKRVSGN